MAPARTRWNSAEMVVFFPQVGAMLNPSKRILAFIFAGLVGVTVRAQDLDTIGVTLLRTVTTNLDGAGIRVAQPEGYDNGTTNWEVNPTNIYGQQPVSLFTYTSSLGSTTNFPNGLNAESGHADAVAGNFYGMPWGVATNVAHVDNYDAYYFVNISTLIIGLATNYVVMLPSTNINDRVVNQSFIAGYVPSDVPVAEQQAIDSAYDNYAVQYNTLFVSGVGNGGPVNPPATCYNGLGVGAYGGYSSTGPTVDNGRAKPDITVAGTPANVTSFSTPFVSGAAAVLIQAGLRGDGGPDTNSAADIRTVKALLLNGAVKPSNWTNSNSSPLDARYGAGVLNVFNAYEQLAGGKQGSIVSTTVSIGGAHPPTGATGTVSVLSGWDFNTNTSAAHPSALDAVNHYYFNVTNGVGDANFTATLTLAWNRQQNQTAINDLNLFLFNCANSNLVACSTSLVDNVEHIFVPKLPPGRYDLQVWKAGGAGVVSAAEPYALAWEFFSQSLNAVKSGANLSVSWPVYPDGFVLASATDLVPPVAWDTNNPAPVVTNSQKVVQLNATNPARFFRLQRP
jgi:hypothetical protein